MKIAVQVKPNSKKETVEPISENTYRVRVNAPPVDGKANEAVIRLLAKYFSIPKSSIILLRGEKSKQKLFELQLENDSLLIRSGATPRSRR